MSDNIIQLNQNAIHTELKDLVKNSVEETLNAMLDAEADRLVNAERYARDEERKGYRAGHYDRTFSTSAGEVNLKMPKLKGVAFETAIIERYRRRETSVEEALMEMYLQAYQFAGWRTLQKPSGGPKYLRERSATSIKKHMGILKSGGTVRLGTVIHMFMLTVSS